MKKKITLIVLALACLLVLAGCGCDHEWEAADCDTPKTCSLCGETEGEALGHQWVDGDCVTPKTCSVCGETEGETLGHTWIDATCTEAKTCSLCGETEGEALGHSWINATTEAPKTCSLCGETEGERIITDARFTTAEAAVLMGSWQGEVSLTGEDMGYPEMEGSILFDVVVTFGNAGDLELVMTVKDLEGYKSVMEQYLITALYAEFAAQGIDQETADAGMQATYGMTVAEFAAASVESVDAESLTESLSMVYYVEDGALYGGYSWDEDLEVQNYTLDGDKLSLNLDAVTTLELTRVVD